MSFCPSCGMQNPDGVAFCAQCGQSMTMQSTYVPPVSDSPMPVAANIMAIISMVCGIVSLCSLYVGFVFSIPALILSALSRGKTPAGVNNSKARVGLITGIIGLGLSFLWFIILVAIFGL